MLGILDSMQQADGGSRDGNGSGGGAAAATRPILLGPPDNTQQSSGGGGYGAQHTTWMQLSPLMTIPNGARLWTVGMEVDDDDEPEWDMKGRNNNATLNAAR